MKMYISNWVNPSSFSFKIQLQGLGGDQGASYKCFEHCNSNLAFFFPIMLSNFKIIFKVDAFETDE